MFCSRSILNDAFYGTNSINNKIREDKDIYKHIHTHTHTHTHTQIHTSTYVAIFVIKKGCLK